MGMEHVWYKHYEEGVPRSIQYEEKPLYEYLIESASRVGDKAALHFLGKDMTFAEVYSQARKIAHFLQAKGLQKGDRVASMLPNTPQTVIAYYGAMMAGATVVQVNPLFTERELKYLMQDSGAKFIICLDILLPRVQSIKDETNLEHIIVTRIKDYLPFPKNVIYPFIQKRQYNIVVKVEESDVLHDWETIMNKGSEDYEKIPIDPKEDLALLQYTGGTTGKPKGVMLTHFNLVANVQMCTAWIHKAEQDKEIVLGVLPFFHVYGMTTVMNLSIMHGAKMILLPKFDATEVLKTIQKHKPTLFPGAPTIYIALINHPDIEKYDLSSIKACISGSASLPVEIQEQFEKITNGRLVEGYGLTESSPVTHANPIWGKRVYGSIGVPWPDTEAKIVKSGTTEELPIGEIGEIAIRGPQVMKGYWNNEEATKKTLIDGWLLTGDMGRMDEDGYFYVVDRKSDMIIASGFNIYPREIEEVLFEHPGVLEAAVIGVPDDYRGETVKAVIVPKPGVTLDEQELDQYCRNNLAAYKVPRIYEFRDELPKTIVGKVLKRQLVEESIATLEKEKAN